MPALAQQPRMPSIPDIEDPKQLAQWVDSFHRTFQRLWTEMMYTLNALCKVDTLANRSSTPALDETFFVSSDTSQLWGGVSGAWVNVGPRRGLASITNAASSVTITLSPAEPNTLCTEFPRNLCISWSIGICAHSHLPDFIDPAHEHNKSLIHCGFDGWNFA